jgi:hypothetical protein
MLTDNWIPKEFRAFVVYDTAHAMYYAFAKKPFVEETVA